MKPDGTKVRILVVGDLIFDCDLHFREIRRSPEGVPVVIPEPESPRLGGAGAVARMAQALGADVVLAAITGNDMTSQELVRMTNAAGIRHNLPSRTGCATTKTRTYVGGIQQFRVDNEQTTPMSDGYVPQLLDVERHWGTDPDVVLVADYGKGVVTDVLMSTIRMRFPRAVLIVDPAREVPWEKYRGADCLCPNRIEATIEAERCGRLTCDRVVMLGASDRIVIKRDCEGLWFHDYVEAIGESLPPETDPANVLDPCGAGDMVVAALGVFVGEGLNWIDAVFMANRAAGLKCRKRGAVPIDRSELGPLPAERAIPLDALPEPVAIC